MRIQGVVTALITPFINNAIDEEGLAENVRYQIANGVSGVLTLGTTGEAPTLSEEEKKQVIKIVVGAAKGKVPVWVGTGTNSTDKTIENTKLAEDLGADIALIITPYYNKPTQEGIFRHFEAIAKSVNIPIVIYNHLGRCGINIETSTLARLATLPNVVGIKEVSGNILQTGDIIQTIKDFPVMSGDDILTLPMMALGASGVLSVVSNLLPAKVVEQVNAALEGNFIRSRELHYELLPIYKASSIEINPIPIKTMMKLSGMPAGDCRLPLTPMSPNHLNTLQQIFTLT